MKHYLTALIAAILIVGSASAQNVNVGIKGGVNLYNIHNDNGAKFDTKAGFNLGFLGHIHVADQFALQPEIVYSTQGAKYTVANVDTKINLSYVNVPVLFQYMFDNGFRLQAGPQFGFMVNAESQTKNNDNDIKDSFKSADLGVALGMSYVHPNTGFGIDGRYNMGLSNINESNAVKSTNRGFQFGVFYLFKHKS
jgi:hypothetical protein